MEKANASAGFIPEQRTLAGVLRGFHYKGDRAEVRRGWHVSDEWTRKYVPKLPWKVGEKPFDPNVDVKHLRKVKGEAGQRYEAVMANQDDESVQEEWEDDFSQEADEELYNEEWQGSEEGALRGIYEVDDEVIPEDTAEEGDVPVPLEEAGTFAWRTKPAGEGRMTDVTGRQLLRHDREGRLRRPDLRPPTAKSFTSQASDHQHDNLLTFLVDDRFFGGKEPMKQKRAIKESILHKMPDTKAKKKSKGGPRSKSADVAGKVRGKLTNDGAAKLSEEARRMEQNRILRHITEEEFQRETERRMMLATIANPQKRLMLHRYFEEQRAIATKKIEALVRAQEHAMLTDMKLAAGPDLRGPNFEKTYEKPDYFPT